MPQILAIENRNIRGAGRLDDHGIPERNPDEAVQLDRGDHVALGETDHLGTREPKIWLKRVARAHGLQGSAYRPAIHSAARPILYHHTIKYS